MRTLLIASSLLVACNSEPAPSDTGDSDTDNPPADTSEPEDTADTEDTEDTEPQEETGESLFLDHCAGCHGPDGSGTSSGPPIVYVLKQVDEAELLDIILSGTGDMNPIELSTSQAQKIVDYVQSDDF